MVWIEPTRDYQTSACLNEQSYKRRSNFGTLNSCWVARTHLNDWYRQLWNSSLSTDVGQQSRKWFSRYNCLRNDRFIQDSRWSSQLTRLFVQGACQECIWLWCFLWYCHNKDIRCARSDCSSCHQQRFANYCAIMGCSLGQWRGSRSVWNRAFEFGRPIRLGRFVHWSTVRWFYVSVPAQPPDFNLCLRGWTHRLVQSEVT